MQHLLLHCSVGCHFMYGSANISPDFAVNALRAGAMLFCCCYYPCVLFGFDVYAEGRKPLHNPAQAG